MRMMKICIWIQCSVEKKSPFIRIVEFIQLYERMKYNVQRNLT